MIDQKPKRYGSFPRIEVSRTIHDNYEIRDVPLIDGGPPVPCIVGWGPYTSGQIRFDNSSLIDNIYELARRVRESSGGCFNWMSWKLAPSYVEMKTPEFVAQRMSQYANVRSMSDVLVEVPLAVCSLILKWHTMHGTLIPMNNQFYVDNEGRTKTLSTVIKTQMPNYVLVEGELRTCAPIYEIIANLMSFLDVYEYCYSLVPNLAGDDPSQSFKPSIKSMIRKIPTSHIWWLKTSLQGPTTQYGGFSLGLDFDKKNGDFPGFHLSSKSYISAAFAQLTFAIMQNKKFCVGETCGHQIFEPTRKNQIYCDDCGKAEQRKLQSRRYRSEVKRKAAELAKKEVQDGKR